MLAYFTFKLDLCRQGIDFALVTPVSPKAAKPFPTFYRIQDNNESYSTSMSACVNADVTYACTKSEQEDSLLYSVA